MARITATKPSGGLSGLMRVRGFCMNDAHIYCSYDQAKDEFIKVMRLHARYYDLMDIKEYYMRLSLPDLDKLDKYVDQPDKWLEALRNHHGGDEGIRLCTMSKARAKPPSTAPRSNS